MSTPNIYKVKKAILYERLNDGSPKRTIEEHINILQETNTQLVLRAYFRWIPFLDNCDIFTDPLYKEICIQQGFTFDEVSNLNSQIKTSIPDILIIGAIPAQRIHKNAIGSIGDYNEYTNEFLSPIQTEALALDPLKWGILSPTKIELQNSLVLLSGLGEDAWYPDLSLPNTQNLLLGWAKRQIDSGVDGIWIDMLFYQTIVMYNTTNDINHPSVLDSFNAANKLIDDIHTYGNSIGKYIYVGTWASAAVIYKQLKIVQDILVPNLDFLTVTPRATEVLNQQIDTILWDTTLTDIRNIYPTTPIFSFIDSTDDNAPIAIFSQKLTTEQQNQFLVTLDNFFKSRNIIFAYPVHGLYLGQTATKLAYGQYSWYDSKAPEFDTYKTIKKLINPQITPSNSNEILIATALILGYIFLSKHKTNN